MKKILSFLLIGSIFSCPSLFAAKLNSTELDDKILYTVKTIIKAHDLQVSLRPGILDRHQYVVVISYTAHEAAPLLVRHGIEENISNLYVALSSQYSQYIEYVSLTTLLPNGKNGKFRGVACWAEFNMEGYVIYRKIHPMLKFSDEL